MNTLYHTLGISKQSFHQHTNRMLNKRDILYQLLPLIAELRIEHPKMAARQMYELIHPQYVGRDEFIAYCFERGYKIEKRRAFHRTTDSAGVVRFDNLIASREFTGINHVWVSDITYYRISHDFYYLTFIMDLYSRFIVGYSVSGNLLTEYTTLPALKKAIAQRNPEEGLILHSDGGGQYYCKEFLSETHHHKIKNSMCETVYENSHAERVNGTIKNDYLIPYGPIDFNQLKKYLDKAVKMYNYFRPHKSLGGKSPAEYETLIMKKEKVTTPHKLLDLPGPPPALRRSSSLCGVEKQKDNIKTSIQYTQKTVNVI